MDQKVKKGDVIRKTTSLNCPIGAYMRVVSALGKTVHAEVIGSNTGQLYCLSKKRIRVYRMKNLVVSEDLLYRLKNNTVDKVQHPVNIPWQGIYEEPSELIRFYTLPKGYETIYTVYAVRKSVSLKESVIEIILGERVD